MESFLQDHRCLPWSHPFLHSRPGPPHRSPAPDPCLSAAPSIIGRFLPAVVDVVLAVVAVVLTVVAVFILHVVIHHVHEVLAIVPRGYRH